MFSSYIENPQNCSFQGQDKNEHILLLLRAHPITLLYWVIPALILALVPSFLPPFLAFVKLSLALPPQYQFSLLIINYLLVLVILFEGYLLWYFNVYIVTNKKIIDIDFDSLLFENIDLAPLENIQEADSNIGGILRIIFNFGDVFIQTAGARIAIDFEAVPKPHQVADLILDLAHNR